MCTRLAESQTGAVSGDESGQLFVEVLQRLILPNMVLKTAPSLRKSLQAQRLSNVARGPQPHGFVPVLLDSDELRITTVASRHFMLWRMVSRTERPDARGKLRSVITRSGHPVCSASRLSMKLMALSPSGITTISPGTPCSFSDSRSSRASARLSSIRRIEKWPRLGLVAWDDGDRKVKR